MEFVNRHYVMTQVLGRRRVPDYARLAAWQLFQLSVCAVQKRCGPAFWQMLQGKVLGLGALLNGRRQREVR